MATGKRVLVLEPFGGGSHAAFYRSWMAVSRHQFTVLELPAVHWKWRSRHSSLTLALQALELYAAGHRFDALFCSEMLNLPEWRGFAGPLAGIPSIVYFHENQLTYPLAANQTRDYHFAYSNILSAIAATSVWFNSAFHLTEFTNAARIWLRRMPDFKHLELFDQAIASAEVCPPGISLQACVPRKTTRAADLPLTIGWVARWEHDKGPELFEGAIVELAKRDLRFRLILLGQQFRTVHPSIDAITKAAGSRIVHVGYAASIRDYWQLLGQMDVVVSTALHEFFGIGVLEAVSAGAIPLLPQRLAYPEIFELSEHADRQTIFYSGTASDLVEGLTKLIHQHPSPLREDLRQRAQEFNWSRLAPRYDDLLDMKLEEE